MTLRRLISAMLTLALLVTSGSMAVARGHMANMGPVHVLCIDGEAQVVTLGADGAPQEHHPACPDCVMGALVAGLDPAVQIDFLPAARAAEPMCLAAPLLSREIAEAAAARAPPFFV